MGWFSMASSVSDTSCSVRNFTGTRARNATGAALYVCIAKLIGLLFIALRVSLL